MASITRLPPRAAAEPEPERLKAFNRRLARAETDFSRHRARLADCYKYGMPWRHRIGTLQPADQLDEVFDETLMTVLEDFSADMLNTFTPRKNDWLEWAPRRTLDRAEHRQLAEQLARYQQVMFEEMRRSNLYQALQEGYYDLGPGTMVLLINDIDAAKPIHCEAIAATDVRLTRGPFGYIDGIFRPRMNYLYEEIPSVWPEADLRAIGPAPEEATTEVEIADGCWRDWSERGTETWHYVVRANGRLIYEKTWTGEGCCPFVVARWSRDSTTAWGVGPTYRSIPAVKTINHIRYLSLKNYDKHVDPNVSYEDDHVTNVSQGINPGEWIARAPGSREPVVIESRARFDIQVFEIDEVRSAIRRAHYQDRPEQLGKTPPTATQWADEAAERARRMGSPATNLVEELQYGIARRFAYLLARRGVLPRIELNGSEVTVGPVSPLLRAQEQEEVIRLDRFSEMLAARFGPQITMIVIDVVRYADRLARLLGVDKNLLRDEAKIADAIEQLMPILRNFVAGRPGEIAPPPVGIVGGEAVP
jgi:hypothetical protein